MRPFSGWCVGGVGWRAGVTRRDDEGVVCVAHLARSKTKTTDFRTEFATHFRSVHLNTHTRDHSFQVHAACNFKQFRSERERARKLRSANLVTHTHVQSVPSVRRNVRMCGHAPTFTWSDARAARRQGGQPEAVALHPVPFVVVGCSCGMFRMLCDMCPTLIETCENACVFAPKVWDSRGDMLIHYPIAPQRGCVSGLWFGRECARCVQCTWDCFGHAHTWSSVMCAVCRRQFLCTLAGDV